MSDNSSTVSKISEFINFYSKGKQFERQLYKLFHIKFFEVKDSLYHLQFEIVAPDVWADAFGSVFRGLYACIVDSCTSLLLKVVTKTESVSIQLSVSYFQSVKPGELLIIDAYCMKSGSRIYNAYAFIKCRGNLIAFGAQTKQRIHGSSFKL